METLNTNKLLSAYYIITYFNKEYEILNAYIDPKYHSKINEINYQYLINNPLKEISVFP